MPLSRLCVRVNAVRAVLHCVYWLCVSLSLCVSVCASLSLFACVSLPLCLSVCCCAVSLCVCLVVSGSSSLIAHPFIYLFILSLLVHSNNTVTSCYFFNNLARLSNRCVVYIVPVSVPVYLCVYYSIHVCISWCCVYTIIVYCYCVCVCFSLCVLCVLLSLCASLCVCVAVLSLSPCAVRACVLCYLSACVYRSSSLGKSVCLLFF